jgi:hypothetical protein
MKKFAHAAFYIACALALAAAGYLVARQRSGAAAAARPVATRQITPEARGASSGDRDAQAQREAAVNRIAALPNELILDVANLNLDADEGDEQILTVRKTDRTDGRLSIVVADYAPQRRTWLRSWEADTLCTKITTFSIQLKDLVGDHESAIVCTGMDESGAQTIDAFRRAKGEDLAYEPILSLAADSIAIGEEERSEGYQLGQTSGDSWPVYAYRADPGSTNVLDQIKERYAWSARARAYAKAGEERVTGSQMERETVARILTGSESDFESFLLGVWYEADRSPSGKDARLVVFDKGSSTITFYTSESQEVFRWAESHATRHGLYIRCQNESVEDLIRLMDVELRGSDMVALRVFEDLQMKMDESDRWDGEYRKLPQGSAAATAGSGSQPSRPQPAFKLDGPYRSASGGVEISFSMPRYSYKTKGDSESGGFDLYLLGGIPVLELRSIRDDGVPAGRRVYKASFAETKLGKDTIRRLVLSPAKAAIDGLELLQEDDLILEQRVRG